MSQGNPPSLAFGARDLLCGVCTGKTGVVTSPILLLQPERINPELNQKGYNVKSDVWSLGITMVMPGAGICICSPGVRWGLGWWGCTPAVSNGSWVGAHQAGLNLSMIAQARRLITREFRLPVDNIRMTSIQAKYPRVWLFIGVQFPVCWLGGGQWSRLCCSWGSPFLLHPPCQQSLAGDSSPAAERAAVCGLQQILPAG